MNITNGTISRTFKPADYEGRTVTLSFTVAEGDEWDAVLAQVSLMCERHACKAPQLVEQPAPPKATPRKPPQAAPQDPAPAPTEATPLPEEAKPPVTDAVLKAMFHRKRHERVDGEQIKAVVLRHTGVVGMLSYSLPLDDPRRALILAEVEALKPLAHADAA